MIQLLSILQISLISIALLIFLGLLQYIILPYLKIRSFERPDTNTHFFPIKGQYNLWKENLEKHGDMLTSIKEATWRHPDKKIFVNNIGKKVVIGLRDPQYIKEFLQNHTLYRKDGPVNLLRSLMGRGLLLAEGKVWKHHRKIISNSFHYESLKKNVEIVQKTAREFLSNVKPEELKNYSLITKIQEITGEVVGRVFFGEQFHRYQLNGRPLTLVLAELIASLIQSSVTSTVVIFGPMVLDYPILPKFKKLKTQIIEFRKVCMQMVKDRKAQNQSANDLLGSLIATQNSDSVEERITDEEIIDEFITFFMAGMDTTGHLIGMTIYMLTQYPQYMEQLSQERKELFSENVTAEALQKMDKLHNFLKETLRFYSPAPTTFIRAALKDHKILDLHVPKGTWVKPDFYSMFFSEKNFVDPKTFNPERWNSTENKLDPYGFTPFSGGPRNCIGQHLAILEAKVILSEFLERFEFKLKEGYKLRMTIRFMYEPLQELLLELTEKEKTGSKK